MCEIILASRSQPRKLLLNQLKLKFNVIPADIDESQLPLEKPTELVKRLSVYKGSTVADKIINKNKNNIIIISSDQVAVFNNQIYGKPSNFNNAFNQLRKFNNNTIEFITGLSVIEIVNNKITNMKYTDEISKVKLKKLSEQQIKNYINIEEPYQSAASFKLEGLGLCLIDNINTDDYNAIIGLPLLKLIKILEQYNCNLI